MSVVDGSYIDMFQQMLDNQQALQSYQNMFNTLDLTPLLQQAWSAMNINNAFGGSKWEMPLLIANQAAYYGVSKILPTNISNSGNAYLLNLFKTKVGLEATTGLHLDSLGKIQSAGNSQKAINTFNTRAAAGGLAGGVVGGAVGNAAGKLFGNSNGGLLASGILSTAASMFGSGAGSAIANGGNILKGGLGSFSSGAGAATGGLAAANIAMDVFHKVNKNKGEALGGAALGALSLIPGVGWVSAAAATALNAYGHLTSLKLRKVAFNKELAAKSNNELNGTIGDIMKGLQYSGLRFSGLNKSGYQKAENALNEASILQEHATNFVNDLEDLHNAVLLTSVNNHNRRNLQMIGGPLSMLVGRDGMKLNFNRAKDILSKKTITFKQGGLIPVLASDIELFTESDLELTTNIDEFKEGGTLELTEKEIEKLSEDPNVIPEGALHARKHHMEDADNLTKKGIPVVDNSGEQQAEIEREEVILNYEVTKKLEELAKDGSDESAILAGKILVELILNNTIDRTGLLSKE